MDRINKKPLTRAVFCYNFEMEEKFVEYLKEKFGPVESIILHGSRAKGKSSNKSDWDFIVLVNHNIKQTLFRDNVEGEEIEFEVFKLPINKNEILKNFDTKLINSKLVFDKNSNGKELLNLANGVYKEGLPEDWLSEDELVSAKHYFKSAISGMEDNLDNPAMFFKKFSSFYPRIINMWYRVVKKDFSKNIYDSIPEIKEEDPKLYSYLEKLFSFKSTPEERIEGAKLTLKHIFK